MTSSTTTYSAIAPTMWPIGKEITMKRFILLLPAVLLVVCFSFLQADTIHVPSQQPTIQAGINAAVDGDTILVADGTYTGDGNKDINFWQKAIVVMSANGAVNCIIDCEGVGRGFHFWLGEESNSVVQGFTITNGYTFGGGILCELSSPTIRDNIILENEAKTDAAGIYCAGSSPTITGNLITGNIAGDEGGGIYCGSSSPTITDNTISGNTAGRYGGGIYCRSNSFPTIMGNTIVDNSAGDHGGGIYCSDSSQNITGNMLSGNTADRGGGIYCEYASTTITGNTIMSNTANIWGGGIYCTYCYPAIPTITGNIISGNMAAQLGSGIGVVLSDAIITSNMIMRNRGGYGGGIGCYNSSPILTANTITSNRALEWGGGIYCNRSSSPTITNTILWDNHASVGDELWIGDFSHPSIVTISYSDVEGGSSSVHIRPGCTLNWGSGMINDDPLFVDPENDDYHLFLGSPCIDTGDPDEPNIPWGGWRIDMGVFEYDQGFYFDGQNLIKKPFPVVFSDRK